MKNLVVIFVFISVLFIDYGYSQNFAMVDKSPLDVTICRESRNATPIGKIYYSRPKLDGRSFDALAPAGKVWRLGANEATELIANQNLILGGKELPKGIYTLYAIPNGTKWTVIVNKDTDVWGAYSYSEAKDVMRIEVPTKEISDNVEYFSIDFNYKDSAIYMAWGKTQIKIPFTVKK